MFKTQKYKFMQMIFVSFLSVKWISVKWRSKQSNCIWWILNGGKKGVENSCLRVFSFLLVQNFLFLLFISQQGCNLVNKWALFFGSPGLQFEDSFNYFYILIEKKINLKHNFFLIFNISVKIFIFSWSYWSVIIYIF